MSEARRARRQWLINRLEELDARHPRDTEPDPETVDGDPSWGPIGSLARARLDAVTYDALVRRHTEMLALERGRRSAEGDDVDAATVQPIAQDPVAATPIWVA